MFGRGKKEEDPFAALRKDGSYQSTPSTTMPGLAASETTRAVTSFGQAAGPSGLAPAPVVPSAPVVSPSGVVARPAPSVGTRAPRPVVSSPLTRNPGAPGIPGSTGLGLPRTRRMGSGGASIIAAIVLAVIVAIPVLIATSVKHTVDKTLNGISVPSFGVPSTSTPSTPSGPKSQAADYTSPVALSRALAFVAKRQPGTKVVTVRVDQQRFDATVVRRSGVNIGIDLGQYGTSIVHEGSGQTGGIALSQIDPKVPGRIVRELRQRFGVPKRRVDYIVMSAEGGQTPEWVAFENTPTHPGFIATLSGRGLHKNG